MDKKLQSFISSLLSRKVILTAIAFILAIIFPESQEAIALLLGTYVGGNVAQKFTAAHKATTAAEMQLVGLREAVELQSKLPTQAKEVIPPAPAPQQ